MPRAAILVAGAEAYAWSALALSVAVGVALVAVLLRSRGRLRARLRAVIDNSPAAILILDDDGLCTEANGALHALLGIEPGTAVGRPVCEVLPSRAGGRTQDAISRALAGQMVAWDETIAVNGGERALSALTAGLGGRRGRREVLYVASDVSERMQLERRIEQLVDRDAMTGVYNRARLIAEIERQLRYAERSQRSGAVMLIDIDNFAVINDSLGHVEGDLVLRRVAEAFASRLRQTAIVARVGGDEFGVLLPEASEQTAIAIAGELRSLLRTAGCPLPLHASVGIAPFGAAVGTVAGDVLVCADLALQEAKADGGDRSCVYSGEPAGAVGWVNRIRDALENGRLVLYASPIVDLRTGSVAYDELLLRMIGDHGELIPPSQFLPIAERVGLIGELDAWVTRRGLGLALNGARVAINLSGRTLGAADILNEARAAVADGLDADRVVFEITETASLASVASAQAFATALRDLGFHLALDDFGTGFASFSYMRALPVDLVKLDIDLIRDLGRSKADRDVVAAIAGVAHALGKRTVAEGVEDAATAAAVLELGIDLAQGFHYQLPYRISPATQTELDQLTVSSPRTRLQSRLTPARRRDGERQGG